MYPSLMGNFNCPTQILTIGSSLGRDSSSLSSVPFRVLHLEGPWTLPSRSTSDGDPRLAETNMSLSTALVDYQANLGSVVDPIPSSSQTRRRTLMQCHLGQLYHLTHMTASMTFFQWMKLFSKLFLV